MDWLPISALPDIGATTLVILFVLAILTGRLRPQSAVKEIREDRDARVAEMKDRNLQVLEVAKFWENAYRDTDAALREQTRALADLIATVKSMQSQFTPKDGEE